jgi:endonuclease/exonuclease/phosphatase (EEP) superfamily protein YafD
LFSSFFKFGLGPWGLLLAAGSLVCLVSVLGFAGRAFWALDLLSHFRVQYLAVLTLLSCIFLAGRRHKVAAVFLAFALVNALPVLPLFVDHQDRSMSAKDTSRAMLLNVNTHLGDPALVKQAILDADPDLLVLQEISRRWASDLAWLAAKWPRRVIELREDNFGIGLFSKAPLATGEVIYIGRVEVPSILAELDMQGTRLRLVATHPLPPIGRNYSYFRNEQLEQLANVIDAKVPTLLFGDLNTTPWNTHFQRLLQRSGLLDSSRGFGWQPTWPNLNPLLRIPIDHCLQSPDITIVNRWIGPDVASDHYPLIVDFSVAAVSTGNGR